MKEGLHTECKGHHRGLKAMLRGWSPVAASLSLFVGGPDRKGFVRASLEAAQRRAVRPSLSLSLSVGQLIRILTGILGSGSEEGCEAVSLSLSVCWPAKKDSYGHHWKGFRGGL